ncbi:hypothetical protein VB834_22295 [Limnoraphis robusta Tam1]|uniref:Transposase n=1 Tax=Limnoraphis robusta CCNP1315 TaxID=3110306 RepID=A0ABU5TZ08_9CYAN|nr:hypothetical protein [Limnoraphis robusta]MEA5500735.1 hypothetical protein [Limnoraphis robusta BA-68 BA1]MEA5520171.1 hypothetical protein [Limnoraphis robusta CCNP1315]MEA5541764.1 hypothetical protein [Limnoraphis robusta Tam1]MEA5543860.1 hypothetical protein [Limnoraphis robusta CCNP1324]
MTLFTVTILLIRSQLFRSRLGGKYHGALNGEEQRDRQKPLNAKSDSISPGLTSIAVDHKHKLRGY